MGCGVFDQRGRGADLAGEELGSFGGQSWIGGGSFVDKRGGGLRVDVPCRAGGGFTQLDAQVANLGDGVGEQARDLGLKGAGVDNLAERGIGGQRQQ